MRELILHIGMHKTGTTSIQQTLFEHRPLLQEAGWSYFDAEANHSVPVVSAFTEQPHLYHMNRRAGRHTPEAGAAWAAECRARLAAFLAEAPGPRLILSGEGIALLTPAATDALLDLARRHVDRITVLGFVRPPRSYLVSAFQQRAHDGGTLAQAEAGIPIGYRRRFRKYRGHPKVDELRLRLYTRERLLQGCSVASFLDACGIPAEVYPRLAVQRVNVTGSRLGTVLSLAANEAVPVFGPDGAANPARAAQLVRFLDDLAGQRLAVPAPLLSGWLQAAEEDIAWMETVLGEAFAPEERRAEVAGGPADLRSLSWEEVRTLAGAINALLQGQWPRPAEADGTEAGRFFGRPPAMREAPEPEAPAAPRRPLAPMLPPPHRLGRGGRFRG